MNDHEFENLERQLASQPLSGAPQNLRTAVLDDVHRELTAARWDRWLGQVAGMLLIAGVGMNASIGTWPVDDSSPNVRLASMPNTDALTDIAASVANATDAETGQRFAVQLASLAGWSLSREQATAIDSAIRQRLADGNPWGKEG
jgi:hypothetical protein